MRFKTITAMFVGILGSAPCRAQSPTTASPQQFDSTILVGPDTTVFTGPLRADGTIDYFAAVNAQESQGIISASNAACLLLRIVEADLNKPPYIQQRAQTLRMLGMENNPADDVAWQFWRGFQNPTPTDDPANPNYRDRFEAAKTHPWSSQDIPELADWLKSNERALAIVAEASKRPQYWVPDVPRNPDQGLVSSMHSELSVLANIRDALCILSMLRFRQGDSSGALQDLLTAQRLGHLLVQTSEPTAILVGTSFENSACFASWRVLKNSQIPKEQLERWSADLIAIGQIFTPRNRVLQLARYRFLDSVQIVAAAQNKQLLNHMNQNQLPAYQRALAKEQIPLLDWNRVMRLGNSFYDDYEKDRSALPVAQRVAEENAFDRRYEQLERTFEAADVYADDNPPKWITPLPGEAREMYSDRVGTVILWMTMPSVGIIYEHVRICNMRVDWLAKAGVALAIYKNEHGDYPASLDSLIPKYLNGLPKNTSSYSLRYERRDDGYLIRNVRAYSETEKRFLSERHQDFDMDDIIIRTDKSE